MALRIVKAAASDAPLVLELIREMAAFEGASASVEIDGAKLTEYVFSDRPLAEVYLGFSEQRAVAYAMVYPCFSSYRGRPVLFLEDLFVREEARGAGAGRQMIRFLARLAVERGCIRLHWSVLEWNRAAIGFYEKLGARREMGRLYYTLSGEQLEALARPD